MPAGLRASGDDHIGTEIDRATRLFDVHHLLHPQCADGVRTLHQAVRIAQMKRYDRWAEIEDLVEANSTEEMACGGVNSRSTVLKVTRQTDNIQRGRKPFV